MLLVLLAAPAAAVIDSFVAIVALPSIQSQLGASDAGAQLVVAAYILAYAALLITGGRLGDVFGHRRLLVIGLTLFGATSFGAAVAPNQTVLIVARFAQGGAAALMYPQALGQIQVLYRGEGRAIAMAAYGVTLGLAAMAAPAVGGLVIQADLFGLSWRPIFLLNVPLAAIAAVLAVRLLPVVAPPGARMRFDFAGVIVLAVGLVALVLPVIVGRQLGWPWWTWPLMATAIVAGLVFVVHERHASAPLIDLDLLLVRTFSMGLLTTVVFYAGQVSYLVLLTLYLQRGLDLPPMTAGLVFVAVAAGFSLASTFLHLLLAQLGRHVLTVGALALTFSATGLALLVTCCPPALPALIPLVVFLSGIGFGLVIPILIDASLVGVPHEYAGAAAGVLVTAQQVAGAVGVALTGLAFFGLLQASLPIGEAFALTLGINVALFVATTVLVQVMGNGR